MPRKVVHLTSVHGANDTRILRKECQSLSLAGFDVTLIVQTTREEVKEGVRILPLPPSAGGRAARMSRSAFHILRLAWKQNADLYHFHDPELIPVGMVLKALGKRVIFDVHEDVARQVLDKPWIPRALRVPVSKVYRMIERGAARYLDGIVAATPSIARNFPSQKTTVVQNFPRLGALHSRPERHYAERSESVAYVGGLTRIRGAREMLQSMALVNKERPAQLLFAGSISPESLNQELRNQPEWCFVDDQGWLDQHGVTSLMERARLGLVVFHPAANHVESQPNKLFEYMLAGLPVVASNFDYWRQFVEDIGCGIQVDPMEPTEIAAAIIWLLDNPVEAQAMGERGRDAVLKRYTWEKEAEKLIALYTMLLPDVGGERTDR